MQTAGTATAAGGAGSVATGVRAACGGDAPEWIHHEADAFDIKCSLADDILARLVREAYLECSAILNGGAAEVRYFRPGEALPEGLVFEEHRGLTAQRDRHGNWSTLCEGRLGA
jgi:hypothetical protein